MTQGPPRARAGAAQLVAAVVRRAARAERVTRQWTRAPVEAQVLRDRVGRRVPAARQEKVDPEAQPAALRDPAEPVVRRAVHRDRPALLAKAVQQGPLVRADRVDPAE